jgi:hypothetical protein
VVHLDVQHPKACAIQLYNVSREMMGLWAARYLISIRNILQVLDLYKTMKVVYNRSLNYSNSWLNNSKFTLQYL